MFSLLNSSLCFVELQGLELQTGYFSLKQIKSATRNFNPLNKIGEGGFGPVYKVFYKACGVYVLLFFFLVLTFYWRLVKSKF